MRLICTIVFVGAISTFSSAQQRLLVSPNQEVIPIPAGSSSRHLIGKYSRQTASTHASDQCDPHPGFGFFPLTGPWATFQFGFSHGDVMGEWFVAPVRGTIDTFYFIPNGSISTVDSTVIVRIFKSNIFPGHGPGYDYPPPCLSWGYWLNTNDPESGIAAFIQDATDTTWHSTADSNGSSSPSFEPFGSAVWGMGGPSVKLVPNSINSLPMDILPGGFQIKAHPPEVADVVDAGETFFFTMKMPSFFSPQPYPDPAPTQFAGDYQFQVPGRAWKFYPHENGPVCPCCGPVGYKGWWARGSSDGGDPSRALAFDIWYSMTPTNNLPPTIIEGTALGYTLSTDSREVSVTAIDCDYENPSRAGLDSVYARYTVTDLAGIVMANGSVPMEYAGGDTYGGTLPGVPKGKIVRYKFFAIDSTGLSDSTFEFKYNVVDLNSPYYRADTTLPCTTMSIADAGSVIDTSAWFLPPRSANANRTDDGTSGPFSLGGPFVYFGDTLNYAWIGVNGAIALSKTAAETLDVNSNGYPTYAWDLPQRQYHDRSDMAGQDAGLMPKNFIAPFWSDWIIKQDASPSTFGHIRYSATAYPGKFVVEWDTLGDFDATGPVIDHDRFRVILDRTSGAIQFQYDNVGFGGLDTLDLVGIQSDSLTHPGVITPFNSFNKNGYPVETHLRNNLCLTYYPCAYEVALVVGWNLVSVGVHPPSYSKSFLFPSSISPAFAYRGGYIPRQTLDTGGGYWIKVSGAQTICVPGLPVACVDDSLNAGWNIVGSSSKPALVGSLTTTPPGIIASPFIEYSGRYSIPTTINPGHGYFVKAREPGVLHICGNTASAPKEATGIDELAGLDKVTIQDKAGRGQTLYIGSDAILKGDEAARYEMPPSAPEETFDVRYSSGRMVEVYPSKPDKSKEYKYPIELRNAEYPVVVSWKAAGGNERTLALIAVTGKERKTLALLGGNKGSGGNVTIRDPGVRKLILKLTSGTALPKEFALSQNYPNPFNPVTQFTVDVPKAADVEIAVYDVLGRRITSLMTGEQEAGYHTVAWDSKDNRGLTVPSGMYMVRMTAGDFRAVRKVLLLK